MKAYLANMASLEAVASILSKLPKKVCYVGGATTALYLEQEQLDFVRPTEDIDCVVEISSYLGYDDLSEQLRRLGFKHPTGPDPGPICRWHFQEIKVDVMASDGKALGFSNRWYADGIRHSEEKELPSGRKVNIFSVPYFIASKLEAFFDRGNFDYYGSKDVEDIVTVVDGRSDFREDLRDALSEVKEFIFESIDRLLEKEEFLQSLSGHLGSYPDPQARSRRVLDILNNLR